MAKCIYSGRSKPCDKVGAYYLTWQKQRTVEPRLMATSVKRSPRYYGPFSGCLAKTTIHFIVKKPSLVRSPHYYSQIFLAQW